MTDDDPSLAARRTRIDARLESVLAVADDRDVPLVRETVAGADDRWFGQLAAGCYDSMAEAPALDSVLPAAASVELLRGYCRLRGELLVRLADDRAQSNPLPGTPALLAGDYLHSAAYSTLGSMADATLDDCFRTLTDVVGTVTDAFAATYAPSSESAPDGPSFFDRTAGSLGAGAADLGASLADADDARRERLARLGRGSATARGIRRALDAGPEIASVGPPATDETDLREHAERRRVEAHRALRELSATADVTALRRLLAADESTADPPG